MAHPLFQPEYECLTCEDCGIVVANAPGTALHNQIVPCPVPNCRAALERRIAIVRKQFPSAGLPERYQEFTFASWNATLKPEQWGGKMLAYGASVIFAEKSGAAFTLREAAAAVNSNQVPMNDTARQGLVLTGGVGMGKTGLAASVVNYLVEHGVGVMYCRVQDLIHEIQDTYKPGSEITTEEKFYTLITCPVLVLDEFELENYKEDRLEIMEKIIRGRHGRQLPLLATTNIKDAQVFGKLWHQRIGDIVATFHWINVGGEKLRDTVSEVYGF